MLTVGSMMSVYRVVLGMLTVGSMMSVYRVVLGMLTVGSMMSMVTKGKVDITDTVSKVIYRQFQQVWLVFPALFTI